MQTLPVGKIRNQFTVCDMITHVSGSVAGECLGSNSVSPLPESLAKLTAEVPKKN